MKITDQAVNTILDIMKKTGLNPEEYFLSLDIIKNKLNINFTKLRYGYNKIKISGLTIILQKEIDVLIDYVEINNKKGLIFRDNNGN